MCTLPFCSILACFYFSLVVLAKFVFEAMIVIVAMVVIAAKVFIVAMVVTTHQGMNYPWD